MQQQLVCSSCRKAYWPAQSWIHEKCQPVTNIVQAEPFVTQPVTMTYSTCIQCVTKDEEIARLRSQIEKLTPKPAKRDRAKYMRDYRARA